MFRPHPFIISQTNESQHLSHYVITLLKLERWLVISRFSVKQIPTVLHIRFNSFETLTFTAAQDRCMLLLTHLGL